MTAEQIKNAERIINNTETKSYKKLFDQLKAL
jgi:hypothetical protein